MPCGLLLVGLSIRPACLCDQRTRRYGHCHRRKDRQVRRRDPHRCASAWNSDNADGKHAYVALSTPLNTRPKAGDSRVVVIDTSNGKIIRSINVGLDPEQIAVDPSESRLYASNEDPGTATVVDLASGETVATLTTGIEPEGATVSPDGRWAYITAETSSTVTVIDTAEPEVVDTILVGARPRDTAFSPDGKLAYISAELGQTLTVVDVATHTVIRTVSIAVNPDVRPVGVAVSRRRIADIRRKRARKLRLGHRRVFISDNRDHPGRAARLGNRPDCRRLKALHRQRNIK